MLSEPKRYNGNETAPIKSQNYRKRRQCAIQIGQIQGLLEINFSPHTKLFFNHFNIIQMTGT